MSFEYPDNEKLLTKGEVAQLCRVDIRTVDRWLMAGKIVRYGTRPENLDQTTSSPNKWNQSLPKVTYRVRIDGLAPGTTYYFTVDVAQADGIGIGLKSPVNRFTTPSRP